MAKGLGFGLVVGVFGLITPYFSKLYFDNVYPARDVSLMHVLVALVAAFTIASAVMGAIRSYYGQVVSGRMSAAISLMYFNHLVHLPVRFFDEHRVGEIMSRLSDMRGALNTFTRGVETLFLNGAYVLLVPPILLALNAKLAILALLSVPLTTAVSVVSSRITRKLLKRSAEASAELGAIQVETMSQIRTLKVMAMEHRIFRDAEVHSQEALRSQLNAAAVGNSVGVANGAIRAAGAALLSWYAWTLILRGELTLGSFVAFSAYLGFLVSPVGQLASLFVDLQRSAVVLGRAFEYLDLETEQPAEFSYSPPPRLINSIEGAISIDSVGFRYSSEKVILQDVSLSFDAGSVTAIVGNSGTGKSTILRLLTRIERPTSGVIRADGRRLEEYSLNELRRQIAVVWQEPTLLRGTIWENLTVGLDDVNRARVLEALRVCRLDELVESLPYGCDTMVAEWGATLSGGERQRFAIARALVRDSPVLLLDEATSQVDVRTEHELLRGLMTYLKNRTIIMVTHRLATAALADRICVLDGGRVAAYGTHEELNSGSVLYRQLATVPHFDDESRKRRQVEGP